MWIVYDGIKRSIKSINFTLLKEKIESGKKQQTCRTNYIPYFKPNELTALTFKKLEMIFLAPITHFYPKLLKEVNDKEAVRDGFLNVDQFREKICEINHISKFELDHYCFLINWDYKLRELPTHFDGKYYHFNSKEQRLIA